MPLRSSARQHGQMSDFRRQAERAAADAGLSLEEYLAELADPHAGREDEAPRRRGGGEPMDRILSSLDRLGDRIRSMSSTRPERPAAETRYEDEDDERQPVRPTRRTARTEAANDAGDEGSARSLELQRAIEQIARKRDALDRTPAARGSDGDRRPAGRAARPAAREGGLRDGAYEDLRAELRDLKRSMDMRSQETRDDQMGELRRLADRVDAVARTTVDSRALSGLRDDLQSVREAVIEASPTPRIRALETAYDEIVRRLDQLRGAVDNPRTVADLVGRLAEIRRLIGQAPTEAQVATITDRLDQIEGRLGSAGRGDLREMEKQVTALAVAVSDLDPGGLVAAIDHRIAEVGAQIAAIEQRLGAVDGLARFQDQADRQSQLLSMLAQRSEQFPRVAHEMERQSAALDGLTKHVEALPRLSADLSAVRRGLETDGAQASRLVESVLSRIEQLSDRVGTLAPAAVAADPGLPSALEGQLADIARRLTRIEGPMDTQAFEALEQRFAAMAEALETRLQRVETMARDISLPGELVDALARIEAHLASDHADERLQQIETRIGGLADAVGALERSAAPDLSAIEAALAALRDDIAGLATPSLTAMEGEMARLARAVDALAGSPGHPGPALDASLLARIEERIASLADRLDRMPSGTAELADSLARLERGLADAFDPEAIAAAAARAMRPAGKAAEDAGTGAAIDDLRATFNNLRDELTVAAGRDRNLLVAIGEAVERLARRDEDREDAAPARMRPEPDEAAGRLAPADADAWSEIERTLARSLGTPPPAAKPAERPQPRPAAERPAPAAAPVPPDEAEEDLPRIFGHRNEAGPGRTEPVLGPAAETEAEDDIDLPLEPGSGKPRPRPSTARPAQPRAAAAAQAPAEPTKADFIAAARRAAQAASAAEANADSAAKKGGRFALKMPSLSIGRKGAAGKAAAAEAVAETPARPSAGERLSAFSGAAQPAAPAAGGGRFAILKKNKRLLMVAAAVLVVAVMGVRVVVPMFTGSSSREVVAVAPVAPSAPDAIDALDTATPAVDGARLPDAGTDSRPVADAANPPADTALSGPVAPATGFDSAPATPSPDGFAAAGPAPVETQAPDGTATDASADAAAVPSQTDPAATDQPAAASGGVAVTDGPPPPEGVGPIALRDAAMAGDPRAQFEVAARLTEGRGTAQDVNAAYRWYSLAAAQGLAPAQYRLASFYEKGTGTGRDFKKATAWYGKAAEAGNVKAMHNLAVLSAEGAGGKPDYVTAGIWFEKAAEHGLRDSQYNLGILYAKGLGVSRDLTASYKWFAIAAQGGDADAAKKRDDVAQVLDKDSLARARLAVETWTAKVADPAANEVVIDNPAWTVDPSKTASIPPVLGETPLTSEQIADAQALLTHLGFDAGPADGRPGKRTRDAVMAFQQTRGLPQTGEIDGALIRALAETGL